MMPFLDNKTYAGVNLIDFENNPTPRAVALFREVGKLITDGKLKPVNPVMLFNFRYVPKLQSIYTNENTNKFVAM